MLKLMKYEFKQNTLSYLAIFFIFLSLSLIVPVIHRETEGAFLSILFQTLFIVLAIVIVAGVFVNAGRTYLNSMFKRPGYLTMTLPVNTHQLILSKVIPSMFWVIVGLIVVVVGVFVLIFTSFEPAITVVLESFYDLFELWFQTLGKYPLECVLYVLGLLGAITKIMMMLYMCLTLTHTSWIRHHRMAIALVLFFGIQIISGNLLFNGESFSITGFLFEKFIIYDFDSYFSTFTTELAISAVMQWIQCLIPYVITWYCLEKKLEIQ